MGYLAEGEGFEPPVRLPAQRFSRPPHSTTLASLRNWDFSDLAVTWPGTDRGIATDLPPERFGSGRLSRAAQPRQSSIDRVRGLAVVLAEQVGIDLQRDRGARMAEAPGGRNDVGRSGA